MYILEHRPLNGSFWQPYEMGVILSETPWQGIIRRLDTTGGWGYRWREIDEIEALLYMIERAGHSTKNRLCVALANAIGHEACMEIFAKTAMHGEK